MKQKFTLLVLGMLTLFTLTACSLAYFSDPYPYETETESTIPKDATERQEEAISAVNFYFKSGLSSPGLSESALKKRMSESKSNSKYSEEEIDYALDVIKPDWNEQALRSVKYTLQSEPSSEAGLKEFLTSDEEDGGGFTEEQADYAIKALNYSEDDWKKEAVRAVKHNLDTIPLGEGALRERMISSDYYTEEQTSYAIEKVQPDWNALAVRAAQGFESLNKPKAYIKSKLISRRGFTEEQAQYGIDHMDDERE